MLLINSWRRIGEVLEKTLESPLVCKEIQPVNPKGNQSWIFFGKTDVEPETLIFGPPDAKSWLIWKESDAGKDWSREEKGTTEDEMVGWHHWLNGHEFEWTPGVGEGRGGLGWCSPWSCKESDTTKQLNWTEYIYSFIKTIIESRKAHQSQDCKTEIGKILKKYNWPITLWRKKFHLTSIFIIIITIYSFN